ncbi:globin [Nitriliruptoraceae bacterium ZYF776]|nr:globin [Profundirhabdus halotolerans]
MSAPDPLHPHDVFDRVGQDGFDELVERFYGKVEHDPVMRPMYPEDLEPGKRHLALFLAQYWGAGDVYSSERGHPRLRMRHAGFDITPEAALRWAEHMSASIVEMRFPSDVEHALLTYVAKATPTLINRLPDDVRVLPDEA